MRMIVISLLALSVSTVSAAELPCVTAFEAGHAKYFAQIDSLESQEFALRIGGYGLASGMAYCLWHRRSAGVRASLVMCGGLVGTFLVGSQAYRYRIMSQIQVLQDAYKMYEAYYQIDKENFMDESVQDLFKQTGASPSQEWTVAQNYKKMMESGELCGGPAGTEAAMTWDQAAAALVQRKGPE